MTFGGFHNVTPGRFTATGDLVNLLKRLTRRPILDRTGLSGQFDTPLEWNPETPGIAERGPSGASLVDLDARPVLLTAIRDQLGLRLEPRTEPVDVLVIDSVDPPTPD